jgi:hypothetical protein
MAHERGLSGYPADPELNRLQSHLGHLAAEWRGALGGAERQRAIVQDYHATMRRLYELGWDDILDIDAELPRDLMPEEYYHPPPSNP